MTLPLVFGAMGLLALAFLLLPLLRRDAEIGNRAASSVAVMRDQLAEIERDKARGLISEAEAQDAGIEIKRRSLALSPAGGQQRGMKTRGGWVLGIAVVVVGVSGVGLYSMLGRPGVPSVPFAERAAERQVANELVALTTQLRTRLVESEDGGRFDGWILLGQTYMRMGRYAGATEAFAVAAERPEANSATFSQLAEAMIAAEDGVVTPPAEDAIDIAVEMDPLNPAAVYYQAVALDQTGRSEAAYQALTDRIGLEAELAPWMEFFMPQINRIAVRIGRPPVGPAMLLAGASAAPGPDAEDVAAAAAMSTEDRAAFVQSMVERLAARLEDEPDDLEGWLRLANAYRVMDDPAAARAALDRAAPLVPDTGPQRQTYEDLAASLDP